jgi:hypothetical protein
MRSVLVGVLGLLFAASVFGAPISLLSHDKEAIRGRQVLQEIHGVASSGLSGADSYKYKIAGLCKFVGQLIPVSEEAEDLSTKLKDDKGANAVLADGLMKSRIILFVAQVNICTATKTYGQLQGFDKTTEDQDANTLEQNFVDLVRVTRDQ